MGARHYLPAELGLFAIIKRPNSQLFKIIGRLISALFKIIGPQGGFFARFQAAFLLEMKRLFAGGALLERQTRK